MSIKQIIIIASAAATLFCVGCAEEPPKRETPIAPAVETEPVLTSTVAATKSEPVVVEVREPAIVEEEPQSPTIDPEPTVETVDGVTIQRFVTASEIDKREPVDPQTTFGSHHDKVYAFVEVSNESDSKKSLFVHFIGPNDKVSGGIELDIPASVPRWRTWAYTRNFDAPGLWRVEVRDADGNLLGALPFEVEAGL